METLADIRAILAAAGQRIERGALREDPRAFMDALWRQVYDRAPATLGEEGGWAVELIPMEFHFET